MAKSIVYNYVELLERTQFHHSLIHNCRPNAPIKGMPCSIPLVVSIRENV